MKRLLAVALGALLVVAFAGSAFAATGFTFNGYYQVRGFYMDNPAMLSANQVDDSFFDMKLEINMTFKVNKRITLVTRINALNEKLWGNDQWGMHSTNTRGNAYTGTNADLGTQLGNAPEWERAYMQIVTSFGLWQFGRRGGGVAGMIINGYNGPNQWSTQGLWADSEESRDRVVWIFQSGGFTSIAVYEKLIETDGGWASGRDTSGYGNSGVFQDADTDGFFWLPRYMWKNGAFNILMGYYKWNATVGGAAGSARGIAIVEPALDLHYGGFHFNIELDWAWGTIDFVNPALADLDMNGFGAYFDLWYDWGPGDFGFMYGYVEGNDPNTADVEGAVIASGADFQPLYVMFSRMEGLLNNANNFWFWAIWINYNLTEDLLLHAAFGWARRNEWVANNAQSMDYGRELDIGLEYKVMDNLHYGAHFGYFWADDWFQLGVAGAQYDDTWHFDHVLTLTF